MAEVPHNPDESAQESTCAERPSADVNRAGSGWRNRVLIAVGMAASVGLGVAATLLATHRTAVTENGIAYVNGLRDGYSDGFVDGYGASEDDDLYY
jgi:hypothetical protein